MTYVDDLEKHFCVMVRFVMRSELLAPGDYTTAVHLKATNMDNKNKLRAQHAVMLPSLLFLATKYIKVSC